MPIEDQPRWLFIAPERKCKFVAVYQTQLLSFQGPKDCLTCALLPDTAGFFVAHQCISVVDARQAKAKCSSIQHSVPYQASVTEDAISYCNGNVTDSVVDHVVISHGLASAEASHRQRQLVVSCVHTGMFIWVETAC